MTLGCVSCVHNSPYERTPLVVLGIETFWHVQLDKLRHVCWCFYEFPVQWMMMSQYTNVIIYCNFSKFWITLPEVNVNIPIVKYLVNYVACVLPFYIVGFMASCLDGVAKQTSLLSQFNYLNAEHNVYTISSLVPRSYIYRQGHPYFFG